MPGLFHAKIADMHGFFVTHWGKLNASTRNPICLTFHNTCLHRTPILLSSLPPLQAMHDLVFVSLYACVLHCLLLVSGKPTLDDYAGSIATFEELQAHTSTIISQFADPQVTAEQRWQRRQGGQEWDMVFENAILFLRDALLSREFSDAVKCGDSGQVVLVLKVWALSF